MARFSREMLENAALTKQTEDKLNDGLQEIKNNDEPAKVAKEELKQQVEKKVDENGVGDKAPKKKVKIQKHDYSDEVTKGVQIAMPESLYTKMALFKISHKITLKDMVIEAMDEWLQRHADD